MKNTKRPQKTKAYIANQLWISRVAMTLAIVAVAGLGTHLLQGSQAASSGGSGGAQTDTTNLSYTSGSVTSKYHLYAAGLDWTKTVGMLIYADGSGEYGLKNPSSTYLMGGANGMVNVAKRNNMVLVTPLAPGGDCPDGGGSCWYQTSGGLTRLQKTQWAEALVTYIESRYPIERNRVAVGGYSSGAQFTAQAWIPSGAAQRTMTDGVAVMISCGGPPEVTEVAYTAAFKANIHMNWNTGDNDTGCPHDASWSTAGGYSYFTGKGFATSRDILPGVTHDRSGAFGGIMDAQIKEHVVASSGGGTSPTPAPTPAPTPTPAPGTGDANGDGRVNALDLSVLLSHDGQNYVPADFNRDGTVGAADMAILIGRWTW